MHMVERSACKNRHTSKTNIVVHMGHPARHWGAWALIRHYELVLVNPLGGGLVPHRWGCTMPWVMEWVPPGPCLLADMDSSLTFASLVVTRNQHKYTHTVIVPQNKR